MRFSSGFRATCSGSVGDEVDTHHNVMRFSWELVPAAGGESLAIGFDVAEIEDDGRIGGVLGFLDKAPGT